MYIISFAAGCVLAMTLLPAHAQAPRFKPLPESEMSAAQIKAARDIASGPRGRSGHPPGQCTQEPQHSVLIGSLPLPAVFMPDVYLVDVGRAAASPSARRASPPSVRAPADATGPGNILLRKTLDSVYTAKVDLAVHHARPVEVIAALYVCSPSDSLVSSNLTTSRVPLPAAPAALGWRR